MKIIVDAMGGDNAPEAIVKGSVYARDRLGVELVLVGRKEEIEKYLGEDRSNIEIVDARDVITMEDDPSTATRRAYHAQKRRGRRNGVRRLDRRSAHRSYAYRQTHQGCSPRCHGAGAAQPRKRHNAHRLRRKCRVYARVSSPVCIHGQLLCAQNDGPHSAARRTSQHRRGGNKGWCASARSV